MGSMFRHNAANVIIGLVVLLIVNTVFTIEMPLWAVAVAYVTAIIVLLVAFVLMMKHSRALCELCIKDMPLDASAIAAKYRRRFKAVHMFESVRASGVFLTVLFTFTAFSLFFMVKPVWVAIELTFIYLILSAVSHSRLQPWCPTCANGGVSNNTQVPGPVLANR